MNIADVLKKGISWVRSLGFIPLIFEKELLGLCFKGVWRAIKREGLWMRGIGYVDFGDDDRMWTITGMKVAQELMNIRPDIPILLCTGHSDRVDKEKAKEMGIPGFAMKPIDMG